MDTATETAQPEIVNTRVFAAPRELVFSAFSNPDHLARWWGPDGFTNTFQEFDLRPGGAWRFVMHGPDGAEFRNVSEFLEIVAPERIVLRHLLPVHQFLLTMTFAEAPGGTALTWQMRMESAHNPRLTPFLAAANEQNFDRLGAVLETLRA